MQDLSVDGGDTSWSFNWERQLRDLWDPVSFRDCGAMGIKSWRGLMQSQTQIIAQLNELSLVFWIFGVDSYRAGSIGLFAYFHPAIVLVHPFLLYFLRSSTKFFIAIKSRMPRKQKGVEFRFSRVDDFNDEVQ